MKEQVTKFDLEAAFKALDEIGYEKPKGGIKANRIDLKETFTKKLKTDLLVEDYYDVNDGADMDAAKAERDEEIAKAKLARIEKIVDLDAQSPDDLLGSYVGKYIIRCPQCMTLFYKDKADIEESEEDPSTVNVGETCQHCGNTSGYELIGKVGNVEQDELNNYEQAEQNTAEATGEEQPQEEQPAENNNEEAPAENNEENNEANLDEFNLNLDDNQEEKKEESLETSNSTPLTESAEETEDCKDGNCDIKDEENTVNESLADGHADSHETKIIDQLLGILADDYAIDTDKLAELAKRAGMTEKEVQAFIYGNIEESLNNSEALKDAEKNSELATENASENTTLNEEVDKDLDEKLKAHNDYIEYLKKAIEEQQAALAATENKEVHEAIQRRLEALEADLQAALPDAVKNNEVDVEVEETTEEQPTQEEAPAEEQQAEKTNESLTEEKRDDDDPYGRDIDDVVIQLKKKGKAGFWCLTDGKKKADEVVKIVKDKYGKNVEYTINDGYCEARVVESVNNSEAQKDAEKNSDLATENKSENKTLNEDEAPKTLGDVEFTEADLDDLMETELSKPINDAEVETMLNDDNVDFEADIDDIDEACIESIITESLTKVYNNIRTFKLKECTLDENNHLVLEGLITFNSAKSKKINYTFTEAKKNDNKVILTGVNEALGANSKFVLTGLLENKNLKPQTFSYNYVVNSKLVEGLIQR